MSVVSCENPRRSKPGVPLGPPPGQKLPQFEGALGTVHGLYPGTWRKLSKEKYDVPAIVPKPRVFTILDWVLTQPVPVHCWKFQPLFSANVSTNENTGTSMPWSTEYFAALWNSVPDSFSGTENSPPLE